MDAVTVTVGIKAYNEEKCISAAISSALDAVLALGGDVVLADSGSTDGTIAIAKQFPIKIVQLANPKERCCGAGAQLAFQNNTGEYFYILDGDMTLKPGFLPDALGFLEKNPKVAAVGGLVREINIEGVEFQIRANSVKKGSNWLPGIVDRLDCGGLYRTAALRDVGYFADKNLHAFEEFELGTRLKQKGWLLARIDREAIDHFGHAIDGYSLLWRRIRSGYSGASGEIMRSSFGRDHFPIVVRSFSHFRNGLAVIMWWLLLIAMAVLPVSAGLRFSVLAMLLLIPLAVLTLRRQSLKLGLYSFVAWNVGAMGLLTGFFRKRRSPEDPIKSISISSGAANDPA
jgi:glycosyltransferase involved in cell wall biosynthesis